MNAPATAVNLQTTAYRPLALEDIAPSTTHIQARRRARFNQPALEELTASVRALGVMQPILVRPNPDFEQRKNDPSFEIVAGERRWLAAKAAGLEQIPCIVRAVEDADLVKIQLIENLQREDLHEMEEAEGYDALRKLKKLSVDQIAEQLGRSRSSVFARLKLLELCPEARKAFYAGTFEASVALLIARLPSADTQRELLKELSGKGELYWDQDGAPTFRQVQEHIQEAYMADLKGCAFQLNDAKLLPAAGACTDCPKRTGNQKDLFTEIKNPNVCTDPACLKRKDEAWRARVRAEHEAKGDTIISGAQAKKIKPNQYSMRLNEGYVDLSDEDQIGDKWQTYRKAVGKQLCPTVLLEDPGTGKLHEIAKRADVDAALKANGIKPGAGRSGGLGNDQAARDRKARLETSIRLQIMAEIRAASRTRAFDRADTILVASAFFERMHFDNGKRLVDAWNAAAGAEKPKGNSYVHDFAKHIPELSDAELGALFIDMALIGDCHVASYSTPDQKDLVATAERLGIDAAKIRAELTAKAKEKQAAKKKAVKK